MHETTLIRTLLRRIDREGRAAGAARVTSVLLRIGECSGVDPLKLMAAFDALSRGTVAQGADLRIEKVCLESVCERCSCRFRVVDYRFQCPSCGSPRTRVVAGEELVLESVTVVHECDPSLCRYH